VASLAPAQLCTVAQTKEEALIEAVRLCIRPNDTTWGRQTKLRHYIELSETLLGETPRDVADWVRVEDDLPEERKAELFRMLEKSGWQPSFIPDPTLLEDLVRHGRNAG
jgi:acetyl-CoA decarbonylase/synthase complex subunit alpha